jgi:hypothetical protein
LVGVIQGPPAVFQVRPQVADVDGWHLNSAHNIWNRENWFSPLKLRLGDKSIGIR